MKKKQYNFVNSSYTVHYNGSTNLYEEFSTQNYSQNPKQQMNPHMNISHVERAR